MTCLIKAFKQMRSRGLIAKRECYCEHCGQDKMLEAAQQWRKKHKEVRGFVHVGEWVSPPSMKKPRVALVFGSVTGEKLAYRGPDCLAVGAVVAECLDQQGILYEWDQVLGNPILVLVEESVSGIPAGSSHHAIDLSEDQRLLRTPIFPVSTFDQVARNPVRLLNVTKARRLNLAVPQLRGTVRRPRVGDHVELGFLVCDAIAPAACKEFGELIHRIQVESMWVEVMSVLGQDAHCVYCGELLNMPALIDPAKLRIGSPVHFTPDLVLPVERRT